MKKALVIRALMMAINLRQPPPGLIHHSDRGSQYASKAFRRLLKAHGIRGSMSRKGDCWDNSPTERFFRSLKSEWLRSCRFASRKAARLEVLDYIGFYNAMRLHSTIGYVSPMEYEKERLKNAA